MEERDWRVLSLLYDEKSITRTAQSLYISQPALTARLHQIEEELGATIALRTSKGLKFTPQGEYLAQTAKGLLREFEAVRERLKSMEGALGGTLRLAASQFMTKYILPSLLKRFKDDCPGTEFRLISAWSREVYGLLRKKDAQLGFVLDQTDWEGGKVRLFEDELCVASVSAIRLEDLPDLPRIDFRTNLGFKSKLDRWWQSRYSRPPKVCMDVDVLDTCHEMVRRGLGYAILPKIIVERDPGLRFEIVRDEGGAPLTREAWMVFEEESLDQPLPARFVDFVKGQDFRRL